MPKLSINIGRFDHLIRILIGILLMGLADMNVIGAWGWFGAIPLITGALRYCPIYSLLGINTCKDSSYVE
jgi:hypothetical protein